MAGRLDGERERFGECHECGNAFAWTGLVKNTPKCSGCGRQPTELDYPELLSMRAIKALHSTTGYRLK